MNEPSRDAATPAMLVGAPESWVPGAGSSRLAAAAVAAAIQASPEHSTWPELAPAPMRAARFMTWREGRRGFVSLINKRDCAEVRWMQQTCAQAAEI